MEKFNVLFLDLDGVLVTERDAKARRENDLPMEDEYGPLFDEECLEHLKYCTPFPIRVVLTSTWRFQGLEAMQQMWTQRKMPFELLDITPLHVADRALLNGADSATCKAIEIRAWLDAHPGIYKYVIVDDEPIADEQLSRHLVRTDASIGLTHRNAMNVWRMTQLTTNLERPNHHFLGEYSLEGLVQNIHDGLLYSEIADVPHFSVIDPVKLMDQLMERVAHLATHGQQQLALCYGLSMIISFQSNKAFYWLRYQELCGLLCQIAIDLRERELAKMILRILGGFLGFNDEANMDEDYYALDVAIDEIPNDEVVDNRLLYLELMCELRRHWSYSEEENFYAFDERHIYGPLSPADCGLFVVTDYDKFCRMRAAEEDYAQIIDGSQHSLDEILTMLNVFNDEVVHVYLDNIRQISNTTSIPTKLALREAAYANKLLIFAYFEAKNQE